MVSFYNSSCFYNLLSRKRKSCEMKTVNLPVVGEVTILSLVVLLCCITFAVVWALNRRASYSWVGQNILVSIPLPFFLLFLLGSRSSN